MPASWSTCRLSHRIIRGQAELLVKVAAGRLVAVENLLGAGGDVFGAGARNHDDAIAIRHDHIARHNLHAAADNGPVHRLDFVSARPDAAAGFLELKRNAFGDDLIGVARGRARHHADAAAKFPAQDVVGADRADIHFGRVLDHERAAGPQQRRERLAGFVSVPFADLFVVFVRFHPSGGRELGRDVPRRNGDPNEAVRALLRVFPERPDVRVHQARVLQPDRIHAIGNVGYSQSLEKVKNTAVVGFRVHAGRDEIFPGAWVACRSAAFQLRGNHSRCFENEDNQSRKLEEVLFHRDAG